MKLWVGAALVLGLMTGAANAATMIDITPSAASVCDPARSDCQLPADGNAPAAPSDGDVPPAAIAGLVGLLALAAAFRPRRNGLPEVSS